MDKLEKKLAEIKEFLAKKMPMMPSIKSPSSGIPKPAHTTAPTGSSKMTPKAPKPPQPPKAPGLKAGLKKDPVKQAQQLKDPKMDGLKPKEIRDIVSIAGNGQWKLGKSEDETE